MAIVSTGESLAIGETASIDGSVSAISGGCRPGWCARRCARAGHDGGACDGSQCVCIGLVEGIGTEL